MKHFTFLLQPLLPLRAIVLTGCCILFSGCGSPKPEGMPDLYPAQVKVHNSGTPLDGIGVELYKTSGATPYSLGGITDSAGTAKLTTGSGQYTGSGVPAGSYRVVLRQRIELPPDLQMNENANLSPAAQQELEKKQKKFFDDKRKFSSKLSNQTETPLGLEVSNSGGELDVDAAQYK